MHLLHSAAIGTEIIEDRDHQIIGFVTNVLYDADRGTILALLLRRFDATEIHALQAMDILSWGKRVHVRNEDVTGEMTDFVRLREALKNQRSIVGQKIQTKGGDVLGRCIDLQLRTETGEIEWLFPRKYFFFAAPPIPASEILEITPEAIIVQDPAPRGEKITILETVKEATLNPAVPAATRCRKCVGNVR